MKISKLFQPSTTRNLSRVQSLQHFSFDIVKKLPVLNLLKNHSSVANQQIDQPLSTAEANISDTASPEIDNTKDGQIKKDRHTKSKLKLPAMNVHNALKSLKEMCWAKFDETIEISLNMGLDPRKPNQSVKGVARLPYGTGKTIKVCVFARGNDIDAALAAGADVAGAEDIITKIQAGDISVNFNTVIASPEMMPFVGKIGKILGPRGLMPNPRMGTVTKDIAKAVKAAKTGSVQFKVEKKGIIQAGVGKVSFPNEHLLENIKALLLAVAEVKPDGLKGKYFKVAHVSSTMGPSIQLENSSIDPVSPRFMLNLDVTKIANINKK